LRKTFLVSYSKIAEKIFPVLRKLRKTAQNRANQQVLDDQEETRYPYFNLKIDYFNLDFF